MKKAFTLSEMMIAMAVLGILLAIVIPTIVNTRPDERKMLTKKAYYVTEQVISGLINDPQLYPDNTMYCTDDNADTTCYYGFDDETSVTYNGTTYSGKTKFPKLFAEQVNVKEVTEDTSTYIITTADGMSFDFSTDSNSPLTGWTAGTAPASNARNIIVDVNGAASPNCLETDSGCTWADRFRIVVYSNGRMQIHEDDTTAAANVTFDTKVFEN